MSLRIISGLKEKKFTQHVVSIADARSPGERYGDLVALDIPVHHCPFDPGNRISFLLSMRRIFRELRPDAVLVYNFGTHAYVAVAARLAGVRLVYVRVGWGVIKLGAFERLKMMLLAHVARPFYEGEIVNSEYVRDVFPRLLLLPRRRVLLIPNAVDVGTIRARADRARGSAPLEPDRIRLVMVARLSETKDHETLIRAVAILRGRSETITLDLAGDGPERERLQKLADDLGVSDHIAFLGSRNDVPELLGKARIFVLSTRNEGMPNALLEAMAAATPIIATDLPPCREVLREGRCGILVPPRSPDVLADAISRLARDPSLRQHLTAAAYACVCEKYDLDGCIRRYSSLFP